MKPSKREYDRLKKIAEGRGFLQANNSNVSNDQSAEKVAYGWLDDVEKTVQIDSINGKISLVNPLTLRSPRIKRGQVPIDLTYLYPLYVQKHEVQFHDEEGQKRKFKFKKNLEEAQRRKGVSGYKMYETQLQSTSKESLRSRKQRVGVMAFERMVTHHKVDRMLEEYKAEGAFIERSPEVANKLLQQIAVTRSQTMNLKAAQSYEDLVEAPKLSPRAQRKLMLKTFMTDCSKISQKLNSGSSGNPKRRAASSVDAESSVMVKSIIHDTKTLLPKINLMLKQEGSEEKSSCFQPFEEASSLKPSAFSSVFRSKDQRNTYQDSIIETDASKNTQFKQATGKSNDLEESSEFRTLTKFKMVKTAGNSKDLSNSIWSTTFSGKPKYPELDTDQIVVNEIRRHFFDNILSGKPSLNEKFKRPFMVSLASDKPKVYVKLPEYGEAEQKNEFKTEVGSLLKTKLATVDQMLIEESKAMKKSILRSKERSSNATFRGSKQEPSSVANPIPHRKIRRIFKKVEINESLPSNFENTGFSVEQSIYSRKSKSFDHPELSNTLASTQNQTEFEQNKYKTIPKNVLKENMNNLMKVQHNLEKIIKIKNDTENMKKTKNDNFMATLSSFKTDMPYFKHAQLASLYNVSLNTRYEALRANFRSRSEDQRLRQFTCEAGQASREIYCRMVGIYNKYLPQVRIMNHTFFDHILTYHRLIVFEGGHLGYQDYEILVNFVNSWPGGKNLNSVERSALANIIRCYSVVLTYGELVQQECKILRIYDSK